MKKRMLKRAVCMILAVSMLLMPMMGCSSGSKAGDPQKPDSAASTGDTKSADNASVSKYPIVTQPLTLKYWTQMNPSATKYIRSYAENEAYIEMEKRTGIHIDFIHPAQGQEKEVFNLMIASGDLPDIISAAGYYNGGEVKGVDDGVFADLTPYIQKYAPDYYKLISSNAEIMREVTSDDGRLPAFYMIKPVGDPPASRLLFRTDWLKELGLQTPKTIADYEVLFKTLKDKKNIVPWVPDATGKDQQFMSAFGVKGGFYLKDGKNVAFGEIQPEFKEYLTQMNKWYRAGYISKDFPGLKTAQVQPLFVSGKIGVYTDAVAGAYNRAKQLNIEITSAPYPRLKLGDKLHHEEADIWPRQGQETVISKKSKNIIEAVRWLNYGYTTEGAMLFNYGVEGKTYVMENGKPKYTDYILNHPQYDTETTNYILKIHFAPKLMFPGMECNPNLVKSKEASDIRRLWSDDKDVDSVFVLPPISLPTDELDKRSRIMTEVNTYCSEMVLKFILGAEPLSNFDEYVNQVKKMNIDEAVKITQTAYDRYMSKK